MNQTPKEIELKRDLNEARYFVAKFYTILIRFLIILNVLLQATVCSYLYYKVDKILAWVVFVIFVVCILIRKTIRDLGNNDKFYRRDCDWDEISFKTEN